MRLSLLFGVPNICYLGASPSLPKSQHITLSHHTIPHSRLKAKRDGPMIGCIANFSCRMTRRSTSDAPAYPIVFFFVSCGVAAAGMEHSIFNTLISVTIRADTDRFVASLFFFLFGAVSDNVRDRPKIIIRENGGMHSNISKLTGSFRFFFQRHSQSFFLLFK